MSTSTFAKRLQDARLKAGLTYIEAAYQIRPWLSRAQWVSYTTIRRLEHSIPEDKADPVLLWALAKAYGVPVEKLSPAAAEWVKTHLVQDERPSRWIDISADDDVARAGHGPVRVGSGTRRVS